MVIDESISSPEAAALVNAFVDSLGDQILRKVDLGEVSRSDTVLLALNVGGAATIDAGAAGQFRKDDGVFTVDNGTSSVDDYTLSSGQSIEVTVSNAIPNPSAAMQEIFRSGRGELTNDGQSENISISIDALDNGSGGATAFADGTYIVELFFLEPSATDVRTFDIVMEGKTFQHAYRPNVDRAYVQMSGSTEFPVLSAGNFTGIVKRYQVEVATSPGVHGLPDNPGGLQIELKRTSSIFNRDPTLSAVRVLRSDPPRVENVVVKGSTWAPGVEHSFATLVGLGQQLRPLPTQNANTIEIHFDGPVGLAADGSDLSLIRTVRNSNGSVTTSEIKVGTASPWTFVYDEVNFIGRWTLATALADGKYAIHLMGVTGGGQALDGDWTNLDGGTPDVWGDDPARPFAPGNGTAGGGFRFHFAQLVADYDGTGVVNSADAAALGDGNGDGVINASDSPTALGITGTPSLPLRSQPGADPHDDEFVNGADLAVWKAAFLLSGVGDVDGDGDTDGDDFIAWQQSLGPGAWHPSRLPSAFLEQALIGDFAPRVTNVVVSGSQSTHAAFSFDAVDGSGLQLRTVPVGGADTISIVFSEAVNVSAEHLFVVGLRTFNVPELAEFSYDAATYTATWRFEGWALGDQYALVLDDAVEDVERNQLDGEWTNPNRLYQTGGSGAIFQNAAISEFPSGDGNPRGMFAFVMTLLPGDFNLDNVVNYTDWSLFSMNGPNALFTQGDFDGDGWSTYSYDAALISANYGINLQTVWIAADLNGDNVVDAADLMIIANNAGMTGATLADGDLDGDGEVTADDLDLALAHFGAAGLFLSVAS